jgi:hypothetical protein
MVRVGKKVVMSYFKVMAIVLLLYLNISGTSVTLVSQVLASAILFMILELKKCCVCVWMFTNVILFVPNFMKIN